jgi:hypothetical protein
VARRPGVGVTALAYPPAYSSAAATPVREVPPAVVLVVAMREVRPTLLLCCPACGGWHRDGRRCLARPS